MAEWKKVIVSGSTAALASLSVDDLTNDQLVIGGVGGELESSGLTYNGTNLDLTGATTISGSIISASAFIGDGSGLTGVLATDLDIDNFGSTLTTAALTDKVLMSDNGTDGNITLGNLAKPIYTNISGDISVTDAGVADITTNYMVDLTEGTGIDITHTPSAGSTATINVDLTEFATATPEATDYIIFLDGGASGTQSKGEISGLVSASAGNGLTYNGTSKKLDVDYGSGANTAVEGDTTIAFTGASNEITIDAGSSITLGNGGTVTIGLADTIGGTRTFTEDVTFEKNIQVDLTASIDGDVTIGGDLTVNGTTTSINTENLVVEDRYILLNSGSTGNLDAGIVFGGTNGAAQSGSALIWDASYNSNDGRLGVVNNMAGDSNTNQTPNYLIAGVFEGTEANAATAQADHNGNIRIESGEIYIYA